MVLVYLYNGECIEVEDAVRVAIEGDRLICYGPRGEAGTIFPTWEVETYTANEEVAEQLKEEVCEDVTVVANGEATQERA
jgi:hypothetical protein